MFYFRVGCDVLLFLGDGVGTCVDRSGVVSGLLLSLAKMFILWCVVVAY